MTHQSNYDAYPLTPEQIKIAEMILLQFEPGNIGKYEALSILHSFEQARIKQGRSLHRLMADHGFNSQEVVQAARSESKPVFSAF